MKHQCLWRGSGLTHLCHRGCKGGAVLRKAVGAICGWVVDGENQEQEPSKKL